MDEDAKTLYNTLAIHAYPLNRRERRALMRARVTCDTCHLRVDAKNLIAHRARHSSPAPDVTH